MKRIILIVAACCSVSGILILGCGKTDREDGAKVPDRFREIGTAGQIRMGPGHKHTYSVSIIEDILTKKKYGYFYQRYNSDAALLVPLDEPPAEEKPQ